MNISFAIELSNIIDLLLHRYIHELPFIYIYACMYGLNDAAVRWRLEVYLLRGLTYRLCCDVRKRSRDS